MTTTTTTPAKNLTQEAPASPRQRVGGYVILSRLTDKARAEFLGGNIGDYHTDCPLDHMLLDWKGVPYEEVKREILAGADDEAVAAYLDTHGTPRSPEEIAAWSAQMEALNPTGDPEKGEWYAGEVRKLGLEPAETPMFSWLEADDRASHAK